MTTVDFSGLTWRVKESTAKVGPGPNVFSAANVTVDEHGLHLRIARSGPGWTCAEVIAQGSFGYGHYSWTVRSDVTRLDPRAVLGLFTWSDQPDHSHREIDIEVARWGGRHPAGSGVFTVQSEGPGNSSQFSLRGSEGSLHTLTWTREEVRFSSSSVGASTTWSYRGRDVPGPGGGVTPRINLWLFRGAAPLSAQSVTIGSFGYRAADAPPVNGPSAVLDGTWVPTRIRVAGRLAVPDPAYATELTLVSGRASGRGGVNRFSSTYTVGPGADLAFARVASTRKAGPDPAMAQEAALFTALEEASRFEVADGNLVLRGVDGSILAILAPR